jgi:hypothetical protein
LIAEQQNEVLMNNHYARPTSFTIVPEAHADVAEISRNHKGGRGKEKGREKRCPFLEVRKGLGVKVNLGRSQVKHPSNKIIAIDVEAWGIGPAIVVPQNT